MTSKVTGICVPCTSCADACHYATRYPIEGDILKVGKSYGIWYCVVVFHKGV